MPYKVVLTVCTGMEGVGTARRPRYETRAVGSYQAKDDAYADAQAVVALGWARLPPSRLDPEGRAAVVCRVLAAEIWEVV